METRQGAQETKASCATLGHHSSRPSLGPAKHLSVSPSCREEELQQKGLCFPLDQSRGQRVGWRWGQPAPEVHSPWKPSAPHWRAVGRSAKAACPHTQPLSVSISLPSALTGLASHPISPTWGEAGKGVIRSCPPLHFFPLHHPPTSFLTQACSPPSKW